MFLVKTYFKFWLLHFAHSGSSPDPSLILTPAPTKKKAGASCHASSGSASLLLCQLNKHVHIRCNSFPRFLQGYNMHILSGQNKYPSSPGLVLSWD